MAHRSRLSTFVIDCRGDIETAAKFWSAALGRQLSPSEPDDPFYRELAAADGEPKLLVQQVQHESRIHLDIESDDLDAEADRLEALGAKRIGFVKRWWVMEAPSGQRFCVVNPQRAKLDTLANANEWPASAKSGASRKTASAATVPARPAKVSATATQKVPVKDVAKAAKAATKAAVKADKAAAKKPKAPKTGPNTIVAVSVADGTPPDLASAIAKHKRAAAVWAKQPPSHRREHIKYVEEAKLPATRARRIESTVKFLAGERA